jgi:hypothetical protein
LSRPYRFGLRGYENSARTGITLQFATDAADIESRRPPRLPKIASRQVTKNLDGAP